MKVYVVVSVYEGRVHGVFTSWSSARRFIANADTIDILDVEECEVTEDEE